MELPDWSPLVAHPPAKPATSNNSAAAHAEIKRML
jgi:hypothetical protein